MSNPYARLAADAIAKAAVLQTRVVSEIVKGDDPVANMTYLDFMNELDECGHRWDDGECDCAGCARYGTAIVATRDRLAQQER